MNEQRIYIDYEDYDKLEDVYQTNTDFSNAISTKLSTYSFGWLTSDATLLTKLKALIVSVTYPIYDEYYDDSIGYLESETFENRLLNTLARKIGRWYLQHNIEEDLMLNASLEKFISNGGTKSNTKEDASMGSAVIQKSASTPTGITHSTSSEDIDVELSHSSATDTTSMAVTDGYEDKYTNFVGKTDGLHRNEVERDTDISRTSNYGLAMEVLSKIDYSFINDVLREVSQHFIQIY